jgi:succinoglycan biosynthesis protein ExoO
MPRTEMSQPLVSVIVPTFNAAAHIERTLRSALAQTLSDLEVVVVDDGSSDDTMQRVEHLACHDARVRVFSNGRNRGPSYTRNVAMDAALGQWLAVLDADDCMQHDRLETLTREATNGAFDILGDDLRFVHAHGSPPFDHLLPASLFDAESTCRLDPVSFLHLNPPGGNRGIGLIKPIIRTSMLRHSGIRYREDMRLAEDLFFYLELLLSGARLGLLRRGMYDYLVRPDSLSRSKTEADIVRMIQSYDTMLQGATPTRQEGVCQLLRQHRDEMQTFSLPRHRLARAVRQRQWSAGCKVLLSHPLLPWQILRRKLPV